MLLTKIYCDVDDFCKDYKKYWKINNLLSGKEKNQGVWKKRLSLSEIMTIIIYFHCSRYRTFKDYYMNHILKEGKKDFSNLVSYNRFVELMETALTPLMLFIKSCRKGQCSGISFIDSTSLCVCKNQRILSHKVFKEIAARGKTSMGWFYGFKLHLTVNDRGELLNFVLTPGNVSDSNSLVVEKLAKKLFGKLVGDKGYISKKLFKELFGKGIQLITRLRKNMKNVLMPLMDKILLRKRAVIETIIDQLKNINQIEHSRHRSPVNFLVNLISGLTAYTYQKKKPSLTRNWSKSNLNSLLQIVL